MAKIMLLGHAAFMFVASNALSYLAVTNIAVNKCSNKEALKAHLPFVIIVALSMGIMARQGMFYVDYLLPYGTIDLKDTWTTFPAHHIFLTIFLSIVVIFATIFLDALTQDGPRMLNICRNMNVLSLSRFSKSKIKSVSTHEEFYDRLDKLHNRYCSERKVTGDTDKIGVCITSDPTKNDFDEFDAIDKYYIDKFKPDMETFLAQITGFNGTNTETNVFKKHNAYMDSDVHKDNQTKFNWLKSTGFPIMKSIPDEDVNRYEAYHSENCELLRFFDELKTLLKDEKSKDTWFKDVYLTGQDYNGFRNKLNETIDGIKDKYKQKASRDVIEKLTEDSDESKVLVMLLLFYVYAYSGDDLKFKTMLMTGAEKAEAAKSYTDVDKLKKSIEELTIDINAATRSMGGLSDEGKIKLDENKKKLQTDEAAYATAVAVLAANPSINPGEGTTALDKKIERINAHITPTVKTGVKHIDNKLLNSKGGNSVRCDDEALNDKKFKKATYLLTSSGGKYYRNLGPNYYETNLNNIKIYRKRLANLFGGDVRKKVVSNFKSCEDDYLRRNIINGYVWLMIMWPSVELYSAIANIKTAFFKENQGMTFVFMGASVLMPTLYGVFLYGGAGVAQGNSVFMNIISSSKEIVQKVVKVNSEIGSYTFDADDATKVGDIKNGVTEKESDISWSDYGLFYNARLLDDEEQTLKNLKIDYGSVLSVRKTTVVDATSTPPTT